MCQKHAVIPLRFTQIGVGAPCRFQGVEVWQHHTIIPLKDAQTGKHLMPLNNCRTLKAAFVPPVLLSLYSFPH